MDPYIARPGDRCPGGYSEARMIDIRSKLARRGLGLRKLYGVLLVVKA